jgi:hypothetical protein
MGYHTGRNACGNKEILQITLSSDLEDFFASPENLQSP